MKHRTKESFQAWRARQRERLMGATCGKGKGYRKLNYPTFWHALMGCKELSEKPDPRTEIRNPIYIYHCDCCGGIHIGHLAKDESILMYGPESVNIREAQGLA